MEDETLEQFIGINKYSGRYEKSQSVNWTIVMEYVCTIEFVDQASSNQLSSASTIKRGDSRLISFEYDWRLIIRNESSKYNPLFAQSWS